MVTVLWYSVVNNGITVLKKKINLRFTKHGLKVFRRNLYYAYGCNKKPKCRVYLAISENPAKYNDVFSGMKFENGSKIATPTFGINAVALKI